jgi:hypothetical protein
MLEKKNLSMSFVICDIIKTVYRNNHFKKKFLKCIFGIYGKKKLS